MSKNELPIDAIQTLLKFVSPQQLKLMTELSRGEEGEFFIEKLLELAETVSTMPKTYEQDGKGDDAIAYLHYFRGGYDFYITEKDMEEEQYQAFGLVKMHVTELGYVSIVELMENNIEIDLHFEPTRVGDLK